MTSSVHTPAEPGVPQLTQRERVVLTAIATGHTQPAAARRLGICDTTFQTTRASALKRLGADTTTQAVALALAHGQIDPAHVRERHIPAWPIGEHGVGHHAQVTALLTNFRQGNNQRAEASARRRARFRQLRAEGMSVLDAGVQLGIARGTAYRYEQWRIKAIQQDRRSA